MNCDCAFYIGTTHDVCQDYALTGKNTISIADGCSSSVLSDFGSRVLSVTAMNKMTELDSLHDLDEKELILLARPSIKVLNLPIECLDATLLCAIKKDEGAEAICYGDGVITVKMEDGHTIVICVEYTDGYPFYINYLFDKTGRFLNWKNNHDNRKITLSVIKPDGEVKILSQDCVKNPRVGYDNGEIGLLRVGEFRVMVDLFAPEIENVSILSDGVQSFYLTLVTETSRVNEKITYHDVLKELLPFKNYAGKFVQRRMNKFIKTCTKKGWSHSDDISIASIYLGE